MQKAESYVCTRDAGVKGAAAPFKENDVILRARPQTAWRPKDLVTPELFLGRRGAGEGVCRAPTQLNYMNMENHCVVSKLHSDFVLLCLLNVQTTTFDYNFTIMHSKSLRTGTAPPL